MFMATLDIGLNVRESREISAIRGTHQHLPATYYSCPSHPCRIVPPFNEGKGNLAEYDRHEEIAVDSTNKSSTYHSDPAERQCNKCLAGVKK